MATHFAAPSSATPAAPLARPAAAAATPLETPQRRSMTGMLKSELRADDYRAKALTETGLARASRLVLVRAKHEQAASVWRGLASVEDRISATAHQRQAIASSKSNEPRAAQEETADGQGSEEIESRNPKAQAGQTEGDVQPALVR
ncbi:hypothetical protein [Phenylobacterium sp.]|uniref:hypothetical protein n=1 Tax=Phenylobacterium sp. TaxID=1871053 RepID=UPI002611E759|nr:hypothetical protein [Phenylobacterium sp.]